MAQVYSGCGGGNMSPELSWSGAPPGTKSFALTLFDPDAPTGSGWWHWVMFNIPADVTHVPEGTGLPPGASQGRNDFNKLGYAGACPPSGAAHHYIFTIYAMPMGRLAATDGVGDAELGSFLESHNLGKATLTVTWGR